MDKLLIVWSSGEIEVAKKLVLLYGSVILPRAYWDEAHLMVWGPSAKLLAQNSELQEMFAKVLDSGVKASVCVVCPGMPHFQVLHTRAYASTASLCMLCFNKNKKQHRAIFENVI
jgi:hypothetical protein